MNVCLDNRVVVDNKSALEHAIKNGVKEIVVEGKLASDIIKVNEKLEYLPAGKLNSLKRSLRCGTVPYVIPEKAIYLIIIGLGAIVILAILEEYNIEIDILNGKVILNKEKSSEVSTENIIANSIKSSFTSGISDLFDDKVVYSESPFDTYNKKNKGSGIFDILKDFFD